MAGRVSQSFIDELLARIDIVNVIEPYLTLKKTGANYKAKCPFHQEKSPSFTVSPSKQIYHCFGCGVSGNAITFLMNYEHMAFIDALETLASQAGMQIPQDALSTNDQTAKSQEIYELTSRAEHFYQNCLNHQKKGQRAIEYLNKRGLSEEVIQQFNIGYAPSGWDNLLLAVKGNEADKQTLLKAGLLIQNEKNAIYDRFRDRVMFPIKDRRGRVIAFGGRVLSDKDTPKYLNSPETPVFHKGNELYGLYEARQSNRTLNQLLVVEGYMDVISLAQHGITYTVATLGTATTASHLQRLFRLCPEVIFCFDGDRAGLSAAWHALEVLFPILRDDWQAKFLFLPLGEDPDSLIRQEGKEQFETRIKNATTLSEFFLSHLIQQTDIRSLDGKAKLVSLATPYIKTMQADILREMLISALAKKAAIDTEKLHSLLQTQETQHHEPTPTLIQPIIDYPEPIRAAIMLLLQHPLLAKHANQDLTELKIPGLTLFHALAQQIQTLRSPSTGTLLEIWRDKPEFDYLTTLASHNHMIADTHLTKHFQDTLHSLQKQSIDLSIATLMTQNRSEGLSEKERKLLQDLLKKKQNL